MKKRIASLALSLAFVLIFSSSLSPALAHPGRTDGSGGHRDNQNKSGLGSYHYHCGDYPAHLHTNGVCPYSSGVRATATKSTSSASSISTKQVIYNSSKAQVPNYSVFISGVDINTNTAEYPPLVFNNITYIPFTYDLIKYLDLEYIWNQPSNLIINRPVDSTKSDSFDLQFQNGSSTKGMSCSIVKVDKEIIINGNLADSKYPVVNYKNINYLPLTYEIITGLGLTNKWDPAIGFELNITK